MGTVASTSTLEAGIIQVIGNATPEALISEQDGLCQQLLEIDLNCLCQIYEQSVALGEDEIRHEDFEALSLEPRVLKRVLQQRRSAPVAQVLTTLIVASHTHAITKARFVFGIFDRGGEGLLTALAFRDAVQALLVAACCLGRAPRSVWPKPAKIDMLAASLFAAHKPGIRRYAFVEVLAAQRCIWQLFCRFARGAREQHFVLTPWETIVAQGRDAGSLCGDAMGPAETLRSRMCPDTPTAMGGRNSTKHSVKPIQQRPSFSGPTQHAVPVQIPTRPFTPRRNGYFLAVPRGAEESNIISELQELHVRRKTLPGNEAMSTADFEIRDEELRKQLADVVNDNYLRWEYRRKLDKTRRDNRGRFWTQSRDHQVRGGDLPTSDVLTPFTPMGIFKDMGDQTSDEFPSLGKPAGQLQIVRGPTSASTQKETCRGRAVSFANVINAACDHHFRKYSLREKVTLRETGYNGGENVRQMGAQSDADVANADTSKSSANVFGRIKHSDIILAFEVFRTNYWPNNESKGAKINDAEALNAEALEHRSMRRDRDIDAILHDPAQTEVPGKSWAELHSQEMTLRNFLKCIWPMSNHSDLKLMMNLIARSKRKREPDIVMEETLQTQAEAIRELVQLFDQMDERRSGLIPITAIERFLCGELVIPSEAKKLNAGSIYWKNLRSVTEYEWFVDPIQCPMWARFLRTRVQDRREYAIVPLSRRAAAATKNSTTTWKKKTQGFSFGSRMSLGRDSYLGKERIHSGKLFKLSSDADVTHRASWLEKDMWLTADGDLCYYSEKAAKQVVLLEGKHLSQGQILKMDGCAIEFAFKWQANRNRGLIVFVLGTDSESELVAWLRAFRRFDIVRWDFHMTHGVITLKMPDTVKIAMTAHDYDTELRRAVAAVAGVGVPQVSSSSKWRKEGQTAILEFAYTIASSYEQLAIMAALAHAKTTEQTIGFQLQLAFQDLDVRAITIKITAPKQYCDEVGDHREHFARVNADGISSSSEDEKATPMVSKLSSSLPWKTASEVTDPPSNVNRKRNRGNDAANDLIAGLAKRMDALFQCLDQACELFRDTGNNDSDPGSAIKTQALEMASLPHQCDDAIEQRLSSSDSGDCGELRCVRLYWRYLVGCAIMNQVRDVERPCFLELRNDGQVDLVGFMSILAHEQLWAFFGDRVPTARLIRELVYS